LVCTFYILPVTLLSIQLNLTAQMSIYIGIDIGTTSLKVALIEDSTQEGVLAAAASTNLFYTDTVETITRNGASLSYLLSHYTYIKGDPVQKTYQVLNPILGMIPQKHIAGVRVCGSGSTLVGRLLNINTENEFRALARGASLLYPGYQTIFEMGGQTSKYILLDEKGVKGAASIKDYGKSGDCAAGTGSFLDQQAGRLKYDINEVGDIVTGAEISAKIAGRCSVFAKSDMIHAQQKGYKPDEILKGLCEAVARNYKSSIIKSKKIKTPVLFIGGVAQNTGVRNAIQSIFKLDDDTLHVPKYFAWLSALGAARA
jgi:predicted CoA-substrate-specific enzyme activase